MDHSESRDVTPAPEPLLKLTPGRLRGATVLTVAGEIDFSTASALAEALVDALAQRPSLLVVDLTPTKFLACAGVSALVAAHQLAGTRTRLVVVAGSSATWRPLHLTRANRVLAVRRHLGDVGPAPRPLVLRTVVVGDSILVTAAGGSLSVDAETVTEELRQACGLGGGVVLFDALACTLPAADVVGSVLTAMGGDGWSRRGVRVLTADTGLTKALDLAGIAHCRSAGPGE